MRVPELIRDIHKNSLNNNSAMGILAQSHYGIYGPGWISVHWVFKNHVWHLTCNLYRVNPYGAGPALEENENFLASYLLVLCEVCKLDLDQIIGA